LLLNKKVIFMQAASSETLKWNQKLKENSSLLDKEEKEMINLLLEVY
jgi:hypothetical protein